MSHQVQQSGGLAGRGPNRMESSAWRGAVPALDVAKISRDFYGELPLQVRGRMDLPRNRVRGIPAALRDLYALRAADAPESEGRRLVAALDDAVSHIWAVPTRCRRALRVAETEWDGSEDVRSCEVDLAREEYERDPSVGKTRLESALDALKAADSRLLGLLAERISLCTREKAALTEGGR